MLSQITNLTFFNRFKALDGAMPTTAARAFDEMDSPFSMSQIAAIQALMFFTRSKNVLDVNQVVSIHRLQTLNRAPAFRLRSVLRQLWQRIMPAACAVLYKCSTQLSLVGNNRQNSCQATSTAFLAMRAFS